MFRFVNTFVLLGVPIKDFEPSSVPRFILNSMIETKLLAFLSLLAVQVFVSIIYKFSQTKGTYAYSPLSAIAMAEGIKFMISLFMLFSTTTIDDMISERSSFVKGCFYRFKTCWMLMTEQVSKRFIVFTYGLAVLYVINNQLAFVLFLHVDIASISMFKSFSSLLAAILLWTFFERQLSREQWASILLQVIGLIIVQYDGCKNIPILAWKYYFILMGSTLITAIASVLNERLIKTYTININIQNAILYSFGLMMNLGLFMYSPDLFNKENDVSQRKGFFEGYSMSVLAIVACNSLLGIVITFVYKYADAIVKTFSTSCATGVLLYINVVMFHLKTNLTVFLGAIVIFISSYLFLVVGPKASIPIVKSTESSEVLIIEQNEIKEKIGDNNKWKYWFASAVITGFTVYSTFSFFQQGWIYNFTKNVKILNGSHLISYPILIENVSLAHPVSIYGNNLCKNATNNKSAVSNMQIMIDSRNCSPIEICSNQMISCYLHGGLHTNSLIGNMMNISLNEYDQNNLTHPIHSSNFSIPFYRKSPSYWEKNRIALLIHFNRPYYERLSLLNIYRDLFPDIFFTGPEAHPKVIECHEGNLGLEAYECLSKVVSLCPNNYTGYLMIHFDLLPILYNLETLNLSSIWISKIGCVSPSKLSGWYWWDKSVGARAIKNTLEELYKNRNNVTNYDRYLSNYEHHVGESYCSSYSDIFYLPQRYVEDWLSLSQVFSRNDVFLEIAFPTLTYLIVHGNITLHTETLLGITFGFDFSSSFIATNPELHYLHRMDLAMVSQQQLVENVVQKSYQTKSSK